MQLKTYMHVGGQRIALVMLPFLVDKLVLLNMGATNASDYYLVMSSILLVGMFSRFGLENYIVVRDLVNTSLYVKYVFISVLCALLIAWLFVAFGYLNINMPFIYVVMFIFSCIFSSLTANLGLIFQSNKSYGYFLLSQYSIMYAVMLLILCLISVTSFNVIDIEAIVVIIFISSSIGAIFVFAKVPPRLTVSNLPAIGLSFFVKNRLYIYTLISLFSILQIRSFLVFASQLFSGVALSVLGLGVKLALAFGLFSAVINLVLAPKLCDMIKLKEYREITVAFFVLILYNLIGLIVACFSMPYVASLFATEFIEYSPILFFIIVSQSLSMLWSFVNLILIALDKTYSILFCTFSGLVAYIVSFYFVDLSFDISIAYPLLFGYAFSFIFGAFFCVRELRYRHNRS